MHYLLFEEGNGYEADMEFLTLETDADLATVKKYASKFLNGMRVMMTSESPIITVEGAATEEIRISHGLRVSKEKMEERFAIRAEKLRYYQEIAEHNKEIDKQAKALCDEFMKEQEGRMRLFIPRSEIDQEKAKELSEAGFRKIGSHEGLVHYQHREHKSIRQALLVEIEPRVQEILKQRKAPSQEAIEKFKGA